MSDEYTSRTRPYLNSHFSGIPLLKFLIASAWDDVRAPFSRLRVLEGNKHVLEQALRNSGDGGSSLSARTSCLYKTLSATLMKRPSWYLVGL